ncbi:MAG: tRNA epoxyqueuosine(34) reductase QueG [Planctomycetes bacterium]|nr:tRNA epoxyqueuosine(34) reductase QueG [Planctomycetota bacterium]
MDLSKAIKEKTLALGFDAVGITTAQPLDDEVKRYFEGWLASGFGGTMGYLYRNRDKRLNPQLLVPGAQSVIVVGLNYKPAEVDRNGPSSRAGEVAHYAWYEDYHGFMKKRLYALREFINTLSPEAHQAKVCVDSVPLAERALAVRAGLGFIGKNHMLIHPELGTEMFLGELITTLALPADPPNRDHCLDCDDCLTVCPTGALRSDGRLDASLCINYLTIERHDEIDPVLAKKIGTRVYGCDACIQCCPHTHQAPSCQNQDFTVEEDKVRLDPEAILDLSEEEFARQFSDSPIKRLGLKRLQRNARISLANQTPEPE